MSKKRKNTQTSEHQPDSVIRIFEPNTQVLITGHGIIHVIAGSINIFGATLSKGQQIEFHSPSFLGSILLESGKKILKEIPKSFAKKIKKFEKIAAIVKFEEIISEKLNWINMENEEDGDLIVKGLYALKGSSAFNPILVEPEVTEISNLTNQPIIFVTGSTNCGKSMTCQYLINSYISKFGKCGYLNLEPNSPFLCLPGILSFHILDQPMIGPGYFFEFPKIVKSYFFGRTKVEKDVQYYICIGISLLLYYIKNFKKKFPLIVDLPDSYSSGDAFYPIIEFIKVAKPDFCIKIGTNLYCESKYGDFQKLIKQKSPFVCQQLGQLIEISKKERTQFVDILGKYREDLPIHQKIEWQYISYFGKPESIFTSNNIYKVSWSNLIIALPNFTDENQLYQIMYLLNGSLVGLGIDTKEYEREEKDYPIFLSHYPICTYIGSGIIIKIDTSNKEFYILTPIKEIEIVNLLLVGELEIPKIFLETPIYGNKPYIVSSGIYIQKEGMQGPMEKQQVMKRDYQKRKK